MHFHGLKYVCIPSEIYALFVCCRDHFTKIVSHQCISQWHGAEPLPKPLPYPILTYCQLNPHDQTSMKIDLKMLFATIFFRPMPDEFIIGCSIVDKYPRQHKVFSKNMRHIARAPPCLALSGLVMPCLVVSCLG